MTTPFIAQSASNIAQQLAAQTAVESVGQHAIGTAQSAAPMAQSFVDAGQSLAIGPNAASQLLEQLGSISQSATMSATQALQYLQGVLY